MRVMMSLSVLKASWGVFEGKILKNFKKGEEGKEGF